MSRLIPVITAEQIAERLQQLGAEISRHYEGEPLVCVCVLKGAFIFFADLVRHITIGPELDFVRLASYGQSTNSSGQVVFSKDLEVSLDGKHVLIVEDIVDTGNSIAFLRHVFEKRGPKSLKICALVDKHERREIALDIDFKGFTASGFIVGYGLDFAEKYRELPAIYELVED